MRIEIWGEKDEQEEPLRLRLIAKSDDSVTLVAVNGHGLPLASGNLLIINKQGISRPYAVNESLGIALDKDGRVYTN